jgi:hypothetical protein
MNRSALKQLASVAKYRPMRRLPPSTGHRWPSAIHRGHQRSGRADSSLMISGFRAFLSACNLGLRGSQYASYDFAKVLKECGITPSMSRKGNCWDNACSETLFGSLKVERLHGQHFATRRQGREEALDRAQGIRVGKLGVQRCHRSD